MQYLKKIENQYYFNISPKKSTNLKTIRPIKNLYPYENSSTVRHIGTKIVRIIIQIKKMSTFYWITIFLFVLRESRSYIVKVKFHIE